MSRTIKGSKGPGFDYWDRVANSGKYAIILGKTSKKINKRKIRRDNKITHQD